MSPSHEQFNAQLAHALSRRKQFVVVLSGASGAQWVGTRREMETWALGSPTKRWDLLDKAIVAFFVPKRGLRHVTKIAFWRIPRGAGRSRAAE